MPPVTVPGWCPPVVRGPVFWARRGRLMPVGDHDDVESCGVLVDLRAAVDSTQLLLKGFDPALVHARDALAMVPLFVQLENLGSAGKALAADRVAGTDLWQKVGFPSAAAWLASLDGTGVGEAV